MNKLAEIERRKKQYLESKAIAEIAQHSRPATAPRDDDFLVKITERLAHSLKQKYQREEQSSGHGNASQLEEWVATHTCGICYEVMVAPQFTPMVLVPCGHTFCKACLSAQRAMAKCPYCRTNVQYIAENQALKSLIQMVHENKSNGARSSDSKAVEVANESSVVNAATYAEQLELCEFRQKVLTDELTTARHELEEARAKKAAVGVSVKHLQAEQARVNAQIESLQEELHLLVSHLERQEDKLHQHEDAETEASGRVQLLERSIAGLQLEMDKAQLIANYAPPR